MLAYLSMMAPRLVELRRVLKATGSLYLHCDPTASQYLKLLLDAVFGPASFVNEIVWRRSQTRSSISRSFRRAHDIILFYGRDKDYAFNVQYKALSDASLKQYRGEDEKGRYRAVPLLVSGKRNGETGRPWRAIDPNVRGKAGMHWVTTHANLNKYEGEGLILWPDKHGGLPNLKYYLSQSPGVPLSDFWDDIDLIPSSSAESLGYPTQKPVALLERIIDASCPPDGVVLDPFCGCGTTIAAAEKLKRRWIGIDLTYLAIALIKSRLTAMGSSDYTVLGEPTTADDAADLAAEDPYQFQWWALGLIGARPAEGKKGADKGIDGRLFFFDGDQKPKQVIVSVKAGGVQVSHVRDLRGVLDREQAQIGVLISFNEPTQPMRTEAASAGFYASPWGQHPRMQLLTVAELLAGERIDMPAGGAQMTQVALPPTPEEAVHPDQLSLGG
jgi:DNA modification methylase